MGFILDMQTFGRERRDELCRDDILHSHFAILGAMHLAAIFGKEA